MTENETKERPLCRSCRRAPVTTKGRLPNGKMRYRTKCWKCDRPDRVRNPVERQKLRQRFFIPCEHCGKVPENVSDFHIDHKDANRHNNSLENLQSLCTDCHQAKTIECKDYLPKHMKIIDETYRAAYKIPQGARVYNFTPFDLIMSVITDYEPTATHCEVVWDREGDVIIGLKAVVWTEAKALTDELFESDKEVEGKDEADNRELG